jgi:hypothetical protein
MAGCLRQWGAQQFESAGTIVTLFTGLVDRRHDAVLDRIAADEIKTQRKAHLLTLLESNAVFASEYSKQKAVFQGG